jgi:MerR family mercuric resistance operon transcriptional regulator
VKRAQQLGFTLREIKDLLALRLKPNSPAGSVKKRAASKLVDIEEKIRTLQRMKRALTKLTNACDGCGTTSECPILEALES